MSGRVGIGLLFEMLAQRRDWPRIAEPAELPKRRGVGSLRFDRPRELASTYCRNVLKLAFGKPCSILAEVCR